MLIRLLIVPIMVPLIIAGCATGVNQDKRLQRLAQEAYDRGNYEEALQHINRAIAIDPEYSVYYHDRSRINRKLGMAAQAEADHQQYVEMWNRSAFGNSTPGQISSSEVTADTQTVEEIEIQEIKDKAAAKMETWQKQMRSAFTLLELQDQDQNRPHNEKAQAWEAFITRYSNDNPFTSDDNNMRITAIEKISYWRNQAETQPIASHTKFILQPSDSEVRSALVMGNGAYQSITALRNPSNDARQMSQALGLCGFDVETVLDANREDMFLSIRRFHEKLKAGKGGVGLFFYAGHGVQIDGENYLVPVDAKIQKKFEVDLECYKMSALLASMEQSGSDLNIVILDACRNNPFRGFRSQNRGLAIMDAPVGSILVYSTAPGMVAEDGDGNNGLFTSMLLKHIMSAELTIEEVLKRVRYDVVQATNGQQVPWESSSLIGDFYFREK